MMENFLGALNMERGIYDSEARMFAPYYRQGAMKVYGLDPDEAEQYLQLAYNDVSAAFSWAMPTDWRKQLHFVGRLRMQVFTES